MEHKQYFSMCVNAAVVARVPQAICDGLLQIMLSVKSDGEVKACSTRAS
jgi:hypothetical protein